MAREDEVDDFLHWRKCRRCHATGAHLRARAGTPDCLDERGYIAGEWNLKVRRQGIRKLCLLLGDRVGSARLELGDVDHSTAALSGRGVLAVESQDFVARLTHIIRDKSAETPRSHTLSTRQEIFAQFLELAQAGEGNDESAERVPIGTVDVRLVVLQRLPHVFARWRKEPGVVDQASEQCVDRLRLSDLSISARI